MSYILKQENKKHTMNETEQIKGQILYTTNLLEQCEENGIDVEDISADLNYLIKAYQFCVKANPSKTKEYARQMIETLDKLNLRILARRRTEAFK